PPTISKRSRKKIRRNSRKAGSTTWRTRTSNTHLFSFWGDLDVYVQMTVEKVDLKSLFAPICAEFRVATTNISGWNDINSRIAIMRRFAHWERLGKRIVLLHCGDHDPGGLHISEFLRSNFEDLAKAASWHPRNLEIDRFGLNYSFIQAQRLS